MKGPDAPVDVAFDSAAEASNEYVGEYRKQIRGEEPRPMPQRTAPGPTHTTPCSYLETNQRKPYMPAEQIRKPGLDEGVSMRQKITD
jgi:hypothetical protein